MRIYVLHRQRQQLYTVGLALEGLNKGGLVRLDKDGLFTSLKRRIGRLKKKTDLGCVYVEQSYDSNRRGHHCR